MCGKIQVTLQVGAIDDIQNGVRALPDQIVPGHDLFQGVWGQRINARQVHDDDVLVSLQLAFLLLHRNTGPVTNELVGAGQGVEQRGFTTVRIARQSNLQLSLHVFSPLFQILHKLGLPN